MRFSHLWSIHFGPVRRFTGSCGTLRGWGLRLHHCLVPAVLCFVAFCYEVFSTLTQKAPDSLIRGLERRQRCRREPEEKEQAASRAQGLSQKGVQVWRPAAAVLTRALPCMLRTCILRHIPLNPWGASALVHRGRRAELSLRAAQGCVEPWLRLAAGQTSRGPRGLVKLIAFLSEASESRPPAFNSNLLNTSPGSS